MVVILNERKAANDFTNERKLQSFALYLVYTLDPDLKL